MERRKRFEDYSVTNSIMKKVREKENEKYNKHRRRQVGIDIDTNKRRYVVSKIKQYMEDGMSNEEAINLVMEEKEIINQFSYLIKNGIDIKQSFRNWTSFLNKNKDKQEHNNDGEAR